MRCLPRHSPRVVLATCLAVACGTTPGADEAGNDETTSTGAADTSSSSASSSDTSSSSASSTTTASDDSGDDGPQEPGELVGSFLVQLAEPAPPENGSTSLFGKIFDGPTPLLVVWETVATEGDCVLRTPRVPFCSTPCGGSAACVEDETCAPYPAALVAGDIAVSGLTTESAETMFTMSPVAEGYQPPNDIVLAYPGITEGGPITLVAAGDVVEAFDVEALGIAPLALESEGIELERTTDILLSWAPPADSTATRIHVELDISHHGGTKGTIECEADDTGTLRIAASLVAGLLDLGVAGFPSIVIRRESTGWTNVAVGRIDLVVSSSVERIVVIEGLISCNEDEDCPDEQTCQEDLTCQAE